MDLDHDLDRVDCHCGWAAHAAPADWHRTLEQHHRDAHGLGTEDFYRPAPWAVADPNPFPRLRLFGRCRRRG